MTCHGMERTTVTEGHLPDRLPRLGSVRSVASLESWKKDNKQALEFQILCVK